jgi:hypothetical protein
VCIQDRRRALSWGPSGYATRALGARVARWLGSPECDIAADGRFVYDGGGGAADAGEDFAAAYSRGHDGVAVAARAALEGADRFAA